MTKLRGGGGGGGTNEETGRWSNQGEEMLGGTYYPMLTYSQLSFNSTDATMQELPYTDLNDRRSKNLKDMKKIMRIKSFTVI